MNVLFLCTDNSCRSILAEATPLDQLKGDRVRLKTELDRIGASVL